MSSYSYSAAVARSSGSNFYWSFSVLPRDKRNAILAIYAFSRLVDDAVDEAPSEAKAREEIALWRRRLKSCYEKTPGDEVHPLLPELTETIRRFQIPFEYFSDLIGGMEMDLVKKRYATFAELETYCYHVASTVGLLCNHLFGYPEDRAKSYAVLLGKAFQLTNIIRDVGKDARMGRIYLPADELQSHRVYESDLLKGHSSPEFLELMRFQARRAWDFFHQAEAELPEEKRRKILPAEIMSAFYQGILKKIERSNFPVLEGKVSLNPFAKIVLMGRCLWRAR